MDVLEKLVDLGVDINCQDNQGWTPVHLSVWLDDLDTLKFILKLKPDLNKKDKWECTPLHAAAYASENLKIIELLIENGANIHETRRINITALHIAVSLNKIDFVKYLAKYHSELPPWDRRNYFPLARASTIELCEILLQNGANVNYTDERLRTKIFQSLYYLRRLSPMDMIFLQWGADVNILDQNGESPLYLSLRNHDIETCKILLKYGADPYLNDNTQRNCIEYARIFGIDRRFIWILKYFQVISLLITQRKVCRRVFSKSHWKLLPVEILLKIVIVWG